jgi:hypothetical protein
MDATGRAVWREFGEKKAIPLDVRERQCMGRYELQHAWLFLLRGLYEVGHCQSDTKALMLVRRTAGPIPDTLYYGRLIFFRASFRLMSARKRPNRWVHVSGDRKFIALLTSAD